MKCRIEQIEESEYSDILLNNKTQFIQSSYLSKDKKLELVLKHTGEFRFGDTWFWGQIVKADTKEVLWQHTEGAPIREISYYPWSEDSKSCYLSLTQDGNQIVKVDLESLKVKKIYPDKLNEKRSNWISFVSTEFDGVIFFSDILENKNVTNTEFFCYSDSSNELVLLNDICPTRILAITKSPIKGSIIILAEDSIYSFNVRDKTLTQLLKFDITPIASHSHVSALYINKLDIVLVSAFSKEDVKYYRYKVLFE